MITEQQPYCVSGCICFHLYRLPYSPSQHAGNLGYLYGVVASKQAALLITSNYRGGRGRALCGFRKRSLFLTGSLRVITVSTAEETNPP